MAYIYKVINKLNGKIYIGKTENSVEHRFNEHCRECFKPSEQSRPLYRAMQKYGIAAFSVETVEEVSSFDACSREQYWIAYYNSYKYGYNATIGGDGRPYVDRTKVLSTYILNNNLTETAKICDTTVDTVRVILTANKIPIKSSMQINKEVLGKAVKMLTKNGNCIACFCDCADAARYLTANNLTNCKFTTIRAHISEAARGKRKSAAGFLWQFA